LQEVLDRRDAAAYLDLSGEGRGHGRLVRSASDVAGRIGNGGLCLYFTGLADEGACRLTRVPGEPGGGLAMTASTGDALPAVKAQFVYLDGGGQR
jgi:hypothetical protein